MYNWRLFDGIFDSASLTGVQLLAIAGSLLVLFLFVLFWPILQRIGRERDIEQVRRHVAYIKRIRNEDGLAKHRKYVRWVLKRVTVCTQRHHVHAEFLGITSAEIALLAHELEYGLFKPECPQTFIMDDGELCYRIDDADIFDLQDAAPSVRTAAVPPPIPANALMRDAEPVATDMIATRGSNAKARRRARRAADRAAKARHHDNE